MVGHIQRMSNSAMTFDKSLKYFGDQDEVVRGQGIALS